ncbi:MAG: hypothetical protein LBE56_12225 [Tannerella sp.]|jgi:transcription antitermination factor NusG|nr:hypothetical protein [Tannerella sp.]
MEKKFYKVNTRFIYNGYFKVKAESRDEAIELVRNHCGMHGKIGIMSFLPDDAVDWKFDLNTEKKIGKVTISKD